MNEGSQLYKIKEMLKKTCNMAIKVPFDVENYDELLHLWRDHKLGKKSNINIDGNIDLKDIFEFHEMSMDHVILFWSCNHEDCVLLCKTENKYMNIKMPLITDKPYSFIATYS
jgi:hypothetical protein|tara:strand:- start:898 stop:1236 length:339 start_codon:yes stop_codon:yes gene_type:complete